VHASGVVTLSTQVIISLFVSILLIGKQLNIPDEIMRMHNRRKELIHMLMMVRRQLNEEELKLWLSQGSHDIQNRQQRVEQLAQSDVARTAEDEDFLDTGLALLSSYATLRGKKTMMRQRSTVRKYEATYDDDSSHLVGMAEVDVRGATPWEVAAFILNADSYFLVASEDPKVDVYSKIMHINPFHTVTFYEMKSTPFKNRTFLNSIVLKKLSLEEEPLALLIAAVPIPSHPAIQVDERHAVRAEVLRSFKIEFVEDNVTRLTFATTLDLKGNIPTFFVNTVVIPALMTFAYKLQVPCLNTYPAMAPV
jgi:hypothetical protein